ncbi:MAG: HAMP domain-containing protein [Betaproteobacteria bacterium]|nr:HAMP domain-containing protein [Betaproteobacteria bacterium]
MLLSVVAWFNIFTTYEREPRARQLSQLMVSMVNLTRSALINAQPDKRHALLLDLSNSEGIHIYPAEADDVIAPLPDRSLLHLVAARLRKELGPRTRLTLNRNGEHAVFVSFRIDESDESEYWVALPRERIERNVPWQWIAWGGAALLLSLAGAYLIMFRVTRPLQALSDAAADIGQGRTPAPVEESGPSEIATLARAFNQMTTDLARLDYDRALILAGISHDLRTPLTRLRMSIEMIELSAVDTPTRDSMIADVEEMDLTIGQFLDFARETSGEASQETDLTALLKDMAAQYARRGVSLTTDLALLPPLQLRAQGLRRAVANLIDNALRHAGNESLLLALHQDKHGIHIEVSDRGPGIPEHETERLKLPFTRLDAARSNVSGAGLGLAIVTRIARANNGRLELLARPGGGLVARITLPLP